MKILYIGGSGQISVDCVKESLARGHEVTVFNRGSRNHLLPGGVSYIKGDMASEMEYRKAFEAGHEIICQFHVFHPDQMKKDLELLKLSGNLVQYVFISTCVVYGKHHGILPLTEVVPRDNTIWDYGVHKAECENMLMKSGVPWTIIRPSHTTRDGFITALSEYDNIAHRILAGKPVILFNDGRSSWTITLARHFAVPFVRLFGNQKSIRQDYILTSDNYYSWNEIYQSLGKALGRQPLIRYVPVEKLVELDPSLDGPLAGDKANPTFFDNTKVKTTVGDFACSVSLDDFMKEVVGQFRLREIESRKAFSKADMEYDRMLKCLSEG